MRKQYIQLISLCAMFLMGMSVSWAQGGTCATAQVITPGIFNANGPSTGNGAENICIGVNATHGDWYSYTPLTDVFVTITSESPSNTTQDTQFSIFEGSCGSLICVDDNDETPGSPQNLSTLEDVFLQGGQTYYIQWDDEFDTAPFEWSLTDSSAICQNATPITCGTLISGNNTNGTDEIDSYICQTWSETGPEDVYVLNTFATGNITVALSGMTGGDLDAFLLNACDPDSCLLAVDVSETANNVPPGTYYVIVDGYQGATSPYDLTVTSTNCTPSCEDVVLECGVSYSGTTVGAGDDILGYDGQNVNVGEGPEVVHTFTTDMGGDITAALTNLSGVDLDVLILSTCDSSTVIDYGNIVAEAVGVPSGTYLIVVDGYNNTQGSYTLTVSSNCTPNPNACNITSITAGAQTTCDPATNTYSQDVIVSYINPPATGNLDVNGQLFPITGSPQTITFTGLSSDGNDVDISVEFENDFACSLDSNALFTAPAPCFACSPIAIDCGITISDSTTAPYSSIALSLYPCDGASEAGTGPENIYSITTDAVGDITATISNTSNSNLDIYILNDCNIDSCIDWGLSTVTITSAPAGTYIIVVDGYNNSSGTFDLLVTSTANCVPPVSCDPGDIDAALVGDTIQYCPNTIISFGTDGTETTSDPTNIYAWTVYDTTGTLVTGIAGFTSFSGDFNDSLIAAGGTALPPDLYFVLGVWINSNGSAVCGPNTPSLFFLNVLDGTEPICNPVVCDPGAVAPALAGTTIDYCPSTSISFSTDGTEMTNNPNGLYAWAFRLQGNTNPSAGLLLGPSYTGDVNADIVAAGGTPLVSGIYEVTGIWYDSSSGQLCGGETTNLFLLNVLAASDPLCAPPCSVDGITAGAQTACVPATNTYTQQVVVSYTTAPSSGTLNVNGQSFPIATSPQTVTLTGLVANGNAVNVTANFSAEATCTATVNSLIVAPAPCSVAPVCGISQVTAGTQTACVPATNTYTQQVTLFYDNAPIAGLLSVNGQMFGITGSPQTVTLTGLTADGNAVNVNAFFTAEPNCSNIINGLFTAPAPCTVAPVCDITLLQAGTQTACAPATDTYTQQVIVTFSNVPSSGMLVVNGQSFPIGSSPQTVTLTSLVSDGASVDVTANFSVEPNCSATQTSLFTAPASCDPIGIEDIMLAGIKVYPNPNKGTFTISLESDESIDLGFILRNALGQTVYQSQEQGVFGQFNKVIAVPSLAQGIYFLEINDGSSIAIERVMINQ